MHRLNFALLPRLGLGLLALQLVNRFLRGHVFLFDLRLLVAAEFIGAHVLGSGKFGDFANALRVQNVRWVKLVERRLFEKVDRAIFERVAV